MFPIDEEYLRRILVTSFLLIFVLECLFALILLLHRMRMYHIARWKQPYLLRRDVYLFTGLAIPFLLILVRRWINADLQNEILWIILTSVPPIWGVGYWLYVELFQLGRHR